MYAHVFIALHVYMRWIDLDGQMYDRWMYVWILNIYGNDNVMHMILTSHAGIQLCNRC